MQQELQVALIQSNIVWEDPQANRIHFSSKIKEIPSAVDLIVLPEMFSTGFSMEPEKLAESMDGETVRWMQSIAKEKRSAIVGSCIIVENKKYYNRILFVYPNGSIKQYDKRHAFTLAGEDKSYTVGNEKLIVTYKGWKICPLICYDLRFPVWSRNTEDYDLLLYVANWPKPRVNAWNSLLKARAIENMCYCIGVNRVGLDAANYEYSGNSIVIDYLGNELTETIEYKEAILIATLKTAPLEATRSKLAFLEDKDQFTIQV